jgi:hypothetical protein
VGFEPTIPAVKRPKTVNALYRAANVIGKKGNENSVMDFLVVIYHLIMACEIEKYSSF